MNASDVTEIYTLLHNNSIDPWIDGGWGVDALLEKQTRPHEDLDIVIQQKDIPKLRRLLAGYKDIPRDDTSAWNFVLGNSQGKLVDVRAVVFDDKGNGLYGPIEKGTMYPADSLTGIGVINGQKVRCISAQYVVKFRSGYELDKNDKRDISAILEKFGIKRPQPPS